MIQRGGGQAFLSDVNFDLINTYQVIQRDPEPLIARLKQHARRHSKDYYYEIRKEHDHDDRVEIAARFIYLNKTCYNGLWRVNSKGEFNVPMGSYKKPAICQPEALRACHAALQGVDVRLRDFRELDAAEGDFVYFDPPYQPLDRTSFTSYAKSGFGEPDQEMLREVCLELRKRGTRVMVSNSRAGFIRQLYSGAEFFLHEVKAPRMVNCKANARGAVSELIITTY